MSRSYIDIQRITGIETKIDENGIPYVTVTVVDRRTENEYTLRMTVDQAKVVGDKIVEAQKEAVGILKQAGYQAWPTRFILPDYPSPNDSRADR